MLRCRRRGRWPCAAFATPYDAAALTLAGPAGTARLSKNENALLEALLRRSSDESLLGAASVVAARLAGATTLADSWLTEQEQAYDCVYYLEDNGVPLAHIGHNGAAALLTAEARERCADLALVPVDLRHGPGWRRWRQSTPFCKRAAPRCWPTSP